MSILLYTNSNDPAVNDRLLRVIESRVSCNLMELFQSIESLTERVRRLPRKIAVAVLLAQNNAQLSELIALKDFLEDVPIILILPDQDKEIISQATRLFPSFISSLDSDLDLVGEVLERMLRLKDMQKLEEKGLNLCSVKQR
jgi:hypothetical protein